jgi:hypothetical protein
MHPLEPIKKKMGWTWADVAGRIREKNGSDIPSREQVTQIVCGRRISPKMADMIHRAFPRISRERLLYFDKRIKSITPEVIKVKGKISTGKNR